MARLEVEGRVLRAIETRLAEPEIVAEFVREYQAERNRLAKEAHANRARIEARLGELRIGIERIVDRVVDGTAPAAMVQRMDPMEAEQKSLEASLAVQRGTTRSACTPAPPSATGA